MPGFAILGAAIAWATPASADPAADPASIWTLQDENAAVAAAPLKDKYYVNGLRLGWTSPTGDVPGFLSSLGQSVWGPGLDRLSIDLSQSIYTPANTRIAPPDPTDRPYAGVLTASFSLLHDSDESRSILGVQGGVVGPAAGGQEIQNGFHDLIGYGPVEGWGSQIHNEPVLELLGEKIWRAPLGTLGGLDVEALPEAEAGLGNLRVYGLAGSVLRIGQGLDSDFGVARVRPGLSGGDAFMPTRDIVWYFFVGADGQVVAHDITINGNTFQHSASAPLDPLVGELEIGVAVMLGRARLSYTQVVQTQEIYGQHGGLHQFGSLALSVRF